MGRLSKLALSWADQLLLEQTVIVVAAKVALEAGQLLPPAMILVLVVKVFNQLRKHQRLWKEPILAM